MKIDEERRAGAFAPGHITGIFEPADGDADPRSRGSRGAGFVLELGASAVASLSSSRRRHVGVSDERGGGLPISLDVANRLLGSVTARLDVRLRHDLPVGQGFGMSAAGATATALAVARLTGGTRRRAVETAHLGDLFGGGGLGGVAAILGGGIEFRRSPGVPPWGRVVHTPEDSPLWIAVLGGPLPSPRLLRDPSFLDRVRRAARDLDDLLAAPSFERLLDASEGFTDRLDLAPRELRDAIRALRRRGAWAAQAMFGRVVFAAPRRDRDRPTLVKWFLDRTFPAVELVPARRGAHLTAPQAL